MTKTGVIGLGHVGSAVAISLAKSGLLSEVYDVRASAADDLPGVPAMSTSPAAVARQSEVIVVAVVSAQQTLDALLGADGILAGARPGLIIILVATVSIPDLQRIREVTRAAGVDLVDCGVTGGNRAREDGYICLVGADPQQFAAVKPVLEGFAKSIEHMGGPDTGMAAKIARNVVIYGCFRAGYEGAALARAAGVDVRQLTKVIDESTQGVVGPMYFMSHFGDGAAGEREIRERTRNLLVKDLDAALELARTLNVSLPMSELVRKTDRQTMGLE